MKRVTVLKWIGLGVAVWSLSLVWPEVNSNLTPSVIAGLALTLTALGGAYVLSYYQRRIDRGPGQQPENRQKHSSRPSRPVPPLSLA